MHLLQHLLYNEKYTIEGARHKLDQLRKEGTLSRAARVAWENETVRQLRREADALVELLDTCASRRRTGDPTFSAQMTMGSMLPDSVS